MAWNKTPKTTTKYPNQTITFTVAKPLRTIIHLTANNSTIHNTNRVHKYRFVI